MAAAKFDLGQLLSTRGALKVLEQAGQSPSEFVSRHAAGDWGEVDREDAQANEDALITGARLLSAYQTTDGTRIWIITEAADEQGRRTATTIFLPSEY